MGRGSLRLAVFVVVAAAIHAAVALGVFALFPAERSFLWKVTSDGNAVYVFGSIHAADRSIYPLDAEVYEAFDRSAKLVLEVDVEGDAAEILRAVGEQGIYPDERTLETELPPDLLGKLKQELFRRGIPFETVRTQRPWLVLLTLAGLELAGLGLEAELGVERHLLDRNGGEREVLALESAELQVELLSGLPEELQLLALEQLLDGTGYRDQLGEIIEAWKTGDAAAIEGLLLVDAERYRDVFQALYSARNAAMAREIAGYLAGDQVHFVVIGAGHLVGDGSVVALLAEEYEVEQL